MESSANTDEPGPRDGEDLVYEMRRATRRLRARAWMLRVVAGRDDGPDGNAGGESG